MRFYVLYAPGSFCFARRPWDLFISIIILLARVFLVVKIEHFLVRSVFNIIKHRI